MGGPCGWTIEHCGCGTCWEGFTPAVRATAAAAATLFVWSATGRRYGLCEQTVRPCNPPPPAPLYQTFSYLGTSDLAGSGPVLDGGQWYNNTGGCGAGCSCASRCEVELPGPVANIIEVRIDGEPVDAVYEVHNKRLLVRVDGRCWPVCQVYGTSGIPSFEVDYHRGLTIPAPVQRAAELLACEYGKDCTGGDCRLPGRLRSLTRQGVSVDLEEVDVVALGKLRTNIKAVDDIIAADNPYGLLEPRQVVSPDDPPARTVTWSAGS